jgi:hypothetical protein
MFLLVLYFLKPLWEYDLLCNLHNLWLSLNNEDLNSYIGFYNFPFPLMCDSFSKQHFYVVCMEQYAAFECPTQCSKL